jgi:hypothetical protein
MKKVLLTASALVSMFTANCAFALQADAEETQALVLFRASQGGTPQVTLEVRYLPSQNAARGPDRLDLQRVGISTDFESVTLNGVLFLRVSGDSAVAKGYELIPALKLSSQGVAASLEGTAFLNDSRFPGPWDENLAINSLSEGRLAFRAADGRVLWFAKASAVDGPFAAGKFAGSKSFVLGGEPIHRCAVVKSHFNPRTGLLDDLHCAPR